MGLRRFADGECGSLLGHLAAVSVFNRNSPQISGARRGWVYKGLRMLNVVRYSRFGGVGLLRELCPRTPIRALP